LLPFARTLRLEADVLVREGKWVDHGIIGKVCDLRPGIDPPEVVSSRDDLLDTLRSGGDRSAAPQWCAHPWYRV